MSWQYPLFLVTSFFIVQYSFIKFSSLLGPMIFSHFQFVGLFLQLVLLFSCEYAPSPGGHNAPCCNCAFCVLGFQQLPHLISVHMQACLNPPPPHTHTHTCTACMCPHSWSVPIICLVLVDVTIILLTSLVCSLVLSKVLYYDYSVLHIYWHL